MRQRFHLRRTVFLLIVLAVLVGLLELNRLLPGGWPGGGGEGGLRRVPTSGSDPDRLRPPEDDLPPLPPDGVTIVLRGAGGEIPSNARVAVDAPGAPERGPDPQGHVVLDDDRLLPAGFLVRQGEAGIRHGPADPTRMTEWTVHLPATIPPTGDRGAPLHVEVIAAENERPIAGAEVTVCDADGRRTLTTGADGVVEVGPLASRARLEVAAHGRARSRHWVHPLGGDRLRVTLAPAVWLATQFVDAEDGTPVTVTRLVLRSPEGRKLWEAFPARDPLPATIEIDEPAGLVRAVLEIWSPAHPVARVPLTALGPMVRLPRGRTLELEVRDAKARRLTGVRVTAHYVPRVLGAGPTRPAEESRVEVPSSGTVPLPDGVPARLLVEAAGSAPRSVAIEADAPPARREVRLDTGVALEVHVVDEAGTPVGGARVVALASAGGLHVQRTTRTLPDGTARLGDLPPGPVEVYAHAPGKAWTVETARASRESAPVDLELVEGRSLALVVESPLGLPLAGVRVHASATNGNTDVVGPDAEPCRTRADGTLVLRDLKDRAYRLRFSLPGYADTVLREIRPGPGVHFVTLVRQ